MGRVLRAILCVAHAALLSSALKLHPAAHAPSLSAPPLKVEPFNLSDVRIYKDTFFGAAQAENTQYLQYLDVDRLLYNFRQVGKLRYSVD